MLKITIPNTEMWDEKEEMFVNVKEQTLQLEHSLVSVSKWEAKWKKPFLSKTQKTIEETIDYIRCMTLTQNVDPITYKGLTDRNFLDVKEYIDDPMSATTFSNDTSPKNHEVITSEIIYYQMIALNIPFECQKWHLNRLLSLIRVCNIKNRPPKKMSRNQIMSRNAALNAERRKLLNTRG
jgi:hypothetical protein